MRELVAIISALIFGTTPILGATVYQTIQGGTGTSSPSGILYGSGTSALKTVNIGNNLTFAGGVLSASGDGTFSTTSANHWATFGLAFSTTSTDYWKTQNTFESLTAGDGLTRTADDFDCDTASGTVFGCLSSSDWTTFNDKQDTITAGDALTLTGTDIDFDGGATPSGDLGGTWASITVTDDSHAHTGTTISGLDISDDTNLAATYPAILTGDTLSVGFSTTTANTWSALQTFGNLSATNATTSSLYIATSTGFFIRDRGDAFHLNIHAWDSANTQDRDLKILLNDGDRFLNLGGDITTSASISFATQTCTNQFIRAMSNAYIATCATIGASDVSLANLTATDSTLTFSGTYTGATARTIGLNLGNANTWTAKQTITSASTTNLTVNLSQIIGDGSGASLITPTRGLTIPFGATTTAWTGTTTIRVGPAPFGLTINTAWCETSAGTLNVKLTHGATNMQMVLASTTIGQQTVSTNNVIVKGTLITLDVGTPASSPTNGSCTFSGPQTSQ